MKRDECYRVDAVLKENGPDITQKVYFVGANGSEHGPYIRKYLGCQKGNGHEYERILDAQASGVRFLHIPRIFDWYTIDDSTIVVISEYVEGQTLEQVVSEQGGSVLLADALFGGICESVLELHCKFNPPMIHRDLKPSNIIIKNGNVNIIDFGIARSYKAGVSSDTNHFGTREYAPPEQFGFGQTDRRSDVYALGLILYYIMTSETPDSAARQRRFASASIPEPLREIIVKATMIDPDERFSDVAELQRVFNAAMDALKAQWNSAAYTQVPSSGMYGGIPYGNAAGAAASGVQNAADQDAWAAGAAYASPPYADIGVCASASEKRGLLSRIPKGVGIAWDILLGFIVAFMIVAGVASTFDPLETNDIARATLPVRAAAYGGVVLMMFPAIAYLVCDRRPLCKVPVFARLRRKHLDIAIAAALLVAGVVVVGITGMLY